MSMKTIVCTTLLALTLAGCAQPTAPAVPIVRESEGPPPALFIQARRLRAAKRLMPMQEVKKQLENVGSCRLKVAPPKNKPLTGSQIWSEARAAHIRVGYFYLCNKCTKWHLNIAGGYAITAEGAVATCFHVVEPKEMKEGYLVATTEDGKVLPVTKILAGSKLTDVCIVQVESPTPLQPLSLQPRIVPGDPVWCYSDPADRPGFFSDGIVNRFYQHWHASPSKDKFPVRMNVSTDWAPGSSGAAVVDRCGNAVGHVSTISPRGEHGRSNTASRPSGETVIVFHDAVPAADVLALLRQK